MTTVSTLRINLDAESASFEQDLKKAEARLRSFSRRAEAANDATGGMSKSFQSATQSLSAMGGPLSGVAGRLGTMDSLVNSTTMSWAAFGAAVSAAGFIAVRAATEFAEMERQNLRTEALLKATGNSAGFTAKQLDDMARSVALNTLATTQGVRDAQAVLLTFKAVTGDTFTESISLAQDMAAVFGSDITSAAMQLGQALEMPTEGVSALNESGVSFTASQQEMIKSLEDTGRVADAQRIILDQLRDQVGGAATSEAGGLAGSVNTLGQRWQELLESIGKTEIVGGTAKAALNGISSALEGLKERIDPDPQDLLEEKTKRLAELRKEMEEASKPKAISQNTYVGGVQNQAQLNTDYSYLTGGNTKLAMEREEAQLVSHIANLNAIIEKQTADEATAKQQAEEAARVRDEEARLAREAAAQAEADKKLLIAQEAGVRTLETIDSQLANEEERLKLANERRLQQIAELQLAETELNRLGYENLELLKDEYRLRSDEKYAADLEALRARKEEEARIEIEAEKKKQQKLAAEQTKWDQTVTNMQMNLANQALGFIKSVSEEGSAMWVAATIAQKALAITQAIINTEVAAVGAMAAMPGPPGIAMAATVRGLGYASVGLIAAQGVAEIAGAREKGGFVGGNRSYLIGEAGPEIFTPGAGGQITSNDNLLKAMGDSGKGSGGVVVNIIDQAGVNTEVDESEDEFGRKVINVLLMDQRDGGEVTSGYQTMWNLSRKGQF